MRGSLNHKMTTPAMYHCLDWSTPSEYLLHVPPTYPSNLSLQLIPPTYPSDLSLQLIPLTQTSSDNPQTETDPLIILRLPPSLTQPSNIQWTDPAPLIIHRLAWYTPQTHRMEYPVLWPQKPSSYPTHIRSLTSSFGQCGVNDSFYQLFQH